MTKCLYNPVRECEYAECKNCPDYAEITDEIFEQLIMLFDAYEFQCFVREKKLGEKKNS